MNSFPCPHSQNFSTASSIDSLSSNWFSAPLVSQAVLLEMTRYWYRYWNWVLADIDSHLTFTLHRIQNDEVEKINLIKSIRTKDSLADINRGYWITAISTFYIWFVLILILSVMMTNANWMAARVYKSILYTHICMMIYTAFTDALERINNSWQKEWNLNTDFSKVGYYSNINTNTSQY